jgi:hypothetical protein
MYIISREGLRPNEVLCSGVGLQTLEQKLGTRPRGLQRTRAGCARVPAQTQKKTRMRQVGSRQVLPSQRQ